MLNYKEKGERRTKNGAEIFEAFLSETFVKTFGSAKTRENRSCVFGVARCFLRPSRFCWKYWFEKRLSGALLGRPFRLCGGEEESSVPFA